MMWLVKLKDNWADEMDIEGFAIMSTEEFGKWAVALDKVAARINSGFIFEWYIGTNEWIDYHDGDDFRKTFQCSTITDTQASILKALLINENRHSYGIFPSLNDMNWWLEDIEKEEKGREDET